LCFCLNEFVHTDDILFALERAIYTRLSIWNRENSYILLSLWLIFAWTCFCHVERQQQHLWWWYDRSNKYFSFSLAQWLIRWGELFSKHNWNPHTTPSDEFVVFYRFLSSRETSIQSWPPLKQRLECTRTRTRYPPPMRFNPSVSTRYFEQFVNSCKPGSFLTNNSKNIQKKIEKKSYEKKKKKSVSHIE